MIVGEKFILKFLLSLEREIKLLRILNDKPFRIPLNYLTCAIRRIFAVA